MNIFLDYIIFLAGASKLTEANSPHVFNLIKHCSKPNTNPEIKIVVNRIINTLKADNSNISHLDLGAGSRKLKAHQLRISQIAKNSLKSTTQACFIAKVAEYINATRIVELGTSLGTTSIAISLLNPRSQIFTIEGSPEIANRASALFDSLQLMNINLINGNFDDEFLHVLNKVKHFDMLLVDGNHSYEATIKYFNLALNYFRNGSVIIFDDIRWSSGMKKAWDEIISNENVKISLDLFAMGIVIFGNNYEKQNFKYNSPRFLLG